MNKHTPGPWEIHEENTVLGPKLDDKSIWLRPIVLQSKTGIKLEDARLIAAAPDLLDAIQDLLNQFEQRGIFVDPQHPDRISVNKARAAIAKAKGEV